MKKSNQQGFTLIELIIVIVILGILAVTASPKFLDIQGDARGATVEGLEASLKGAVNIAYSKALIQGVTGTAAVPASTSNPVIPMVFGYPEATSANMLSLLDITAADWEIGVDGETVRIFPVGDYEGDALNTHDDANELACYVEYVEATSSTVPAVTSSDTSGC
jgi:MSHA pilin protein MshA